MIRQHRSAGVMSSSGKVLYHYAVVEADALEQDVRDLSWEDILPMPGLASLVRNKVALTVSQR